MANSWKAKATHASKPCRATSALAGHACTSAGQAASALHSMAVLQVFQAKLLQIMDEAGSDLAAFRELRSVTTKTTKTMAQAIGRPMASLVVLEHHMWLNLTEIKDADKIPFPRLTSLPHWPVRSCGGRICKALHCSIEVQPTAVIADILKHKHSQKESRFPVPRMVTTHSKQYNPSSREDAHVLRSKVMPLLAKGAIEMIPSAQSESGFYSCYFFFPKKHSGLRPILDQRLLNRALMRWPFRMITLTLLKGPPFELLQSVNLRYLLLKTALVKQMGDLQVLSVSPSCLQFRPNNSKVILKPRHGYVPKVLSTTFRAQVISLSALPPSDEDQELNFYLPY